MNTPKRALVDQRSAGLNSAQKAAIILASLGPDAANAIMKAISDRHLQTFVDAIGRLKSMPASLRQHVAAEFLLEVERRKGEIPGGADEARRILSALGDDERAARLLGVSVPSGPSGHSVWPRLEAAPQDALAAYLANLRPETAALALRQLSHKKIADLLAAADEATSKRLMIELSREVEVEKDVIEALGEAVDAEFLSPLERTPKSPEVSDLAKEIVNLLPTTVRDQLLTHLDAEDPGAGAAIRGSLVAFEGLAEKLDEAGAAALLRNVEKETLLRALAYGKKNAAGAVKFLMANVSKRMADQYQEEMAEMPEVSEEDGEAAQREICSAVRRMARDGEIAFRK